MNKQEINVIYQKEKLKIYKMNTSNYKIKEEKQNKNSIFYQKN